MFLAVNQSSSNNTVLHIYKRRMGLTKRSGFQTESLSVSSVIVKQTDSFTWSETIAFVQLIIPTSHIQQTKVGVLHCFFEFVHSSVYINTFTPVFLYIYTYLL